MRPRRIFVTADQHFNHKKMAELRGIDCLSLMDDRLITMWNSVVGKNDLVYVLGDFGFGSKSRLRECALRLHGEKRLITGNHDWRNGIKACNFGSVMTVVGQYEVLYHNERVFLMLHDSSDVTKLLPRQIARACTFIVHGHNHQPPVLGNGPDRVPTFNVCADLHRLKPVLLDEVSLSFHSDESVGLKS
jgi:calcineurin-like phosphoesterase family protein